MKYRKKPVVIEAVKWDCCVWSIEEIKHFVGRDAIFKDEPNAPGCGKVLYIHTLEGDMKANQDDYIIKGVDGEFYPCKPDIFEKLMRQ